MKYQGRFTPKYPEKYIGNPTDIIYRSGWELSVMFWCDKNETVEAWCSEDVRIPYICPTDNKKHTYFVDFLIKFKNGKIILIELKPAYQLNSPTLKTKKPGKKYIRQVFTYTKNLAKWNAAKQFADSKGWEFNIWTEHTLNELNIAKVGKYAKTI